MLPKIAIIALLSDEVRTTCSKILGNFPAAQIMQYQFNLRLTIKKYSGCILELIYHLTG